MEVVLPALRLALCGVNRAMPAGALMTRSGWLQAGVEPAPPPLVAACSLLGSDELFSLLFAMVFP